MAQVMAERERWPAGAGTARATAAPSNPAVNAAASPLTTTASAAMRSPFASSTPLARAPATLTSATSAS